MVRTACASLLLVALLLLCRSQSLRLSGGRTLVGGVRREFTTRLSQCRPAERTFLPSPSLPPPILGSARTFSLVPFVINDRVPSLVRVDPCVYSGDGSRWIDESFRWKQPTGVTRDKGGVSPLRLCPRRLPTPSWDGTIRVRTGRRKRGGVDTN